MRNKYVSQAFKLKKKEINFEKLLDWTGFKLRPQMITMSVMTN